MGEEISLSRKHNNLKVWVYDALTLELVADMFSSMKKAADYFNVNYRSLLKHLYTKIATMKGGKFLLLFSKELTEFPSLACELGSFAKKKNPY